MKNIEIIVKNSKEAELKIDLLDNANEKIASIEIEHNDYEDILILEHIHRIPLFIFKGVKRFYEALKIECKEETLKISSLHANKVVRIYAEKIVVKEKNDFVTINKEAEKLNSCKIFIKNNSNIRRIDIVKRIIELLELRLDEAKDIVDNKEGEATLTKTQAKCLEKEISDFAYIKC